MLWDIATNLRKKRVIFKSTVKFYLNSSSYDDSHEEIGDYTCYCHHQALNHRNTAIETQDEEEVMHEARVKANHEVTYGSRDEGDHDQEWHGRERVANDKCGYSIVTIQPFSLEYLLSSTIQSVSIDILVPVRYM